MRMNRFNIAGMALTLLLAVSCSFKEKRIDCPCWLTMELSDVKRVSDKASIELLEDIEIDGMIVRLDTENLLIENDLLSGLCSVNLLNCQFHN